MFYSESMFINLSTELIELRVSDLPMTPFLLKPKLISSSNDSSFIILVLLIFLFFFFDRSAHELRLILYLSDGRIDGLNFWIKSNKKNRKF